MNTEQKCCNKSRKFLSISSRWGRKLICNSCGAPWTQEKVQQFPTEQNDLSFVDPDGFKKADETLKYGEIPTEQKGWREEFEQSFWFDHTQEDPENISGEREKKEVLAFIERTLQEQREEKQRCGKDMGDGSICGVILDCHLHDWRQKEALLAYQEELVKKIAAQKDNYNCYECGADGYNEGIDAALSLIKDTKI